MIFYWGVWLPFRVSDVVFALVVHKEVAFQLENSEEETLILSSGKSSKEKMKCIFKFTVGGLFVAIPLILVLVLLTSGSSAKSSDPCALPTDLATNYTFYVTYHDYAHVQHFNSNGSFIETLPSPDSKNVQLRGMLLTDNQQFIVANGDASNSVLFGSTSCGRKSYDDLATTKLAHPYGIGLGQNPNLVGDHPDNSTILYSSNQNSLEITFHVLHPDNTSVYGHDGVFGYPTKAFKQLRGLAVWDKTWEVFAADEGADSVVVFNQLGQQIGVIGVTAPIALYVSDGILYVSSNDKQFPAVYAYSLDAQLAKRSEDPTADYELDTVFFTPNPQDFAHPVGMGSCGDDLLVLSQDNRSLLKFSISKGKFVESVIRDLKDDPEQLLVLNCLPLAGKGQ